MLQIAYFSTATGPQTVETLHDILLGARANNRRDEISGLLVAGGSRYMQVIEGPKREMLALWSAIRADERHCAVVELLNRPVAKRCFEGWNMAFRRDERLGEFDSFPQTLRFLVRQVEDGRMRSQIELFARPFITDRTGAEASPWSSAGPA